MFDMSFHYYKSKSATAQRVPLRAGFGMLVEMQKDCNYNSVTVCQSYLFLMTVLLIV